jgi:hypothetical protein
MVDRLPPLIPREKLLGNPQRIQPMLSPDGLLLAYLAPDDRDVLQIWVRTLGLDDDRCVSKAQRPVQFYGWCWDSKTIFCFPDIDGDENWHVNAIDLETESVRDLTPWQGVRCYPELTMTSPARPNEMLAPLNVRDRSQMDLWRIDLTTGAAVLEVENPGDVAWWIADDELVVRCSFGWTPSSLPPCRYAGRDGRREAVKLIFGTEPNTLRNQFEAAFNILSYWREVAAHGQASTISELEAYEALGRLLRLSAFVCDNWTELTS